MQAPDANLPKTAFARGPLDSAALVEGLLGRLEPVDDWIVQVEQRLDSLRPAHGRAELRALVECSTLLGVLHTLAYSRQQLQRLREGRGP